VHRAGKVDIPIFYMDNPIGSSDKEWAIEYRVKTLRRAAEEISKHTGRPVDDEAIRKEIIIGNKVRKAVWRIFELQGESEQPPFTAYEFETILHSGHNWGGEPEAYLQVLEEIAADVGDRANHKVHGTSVAKNPVRIFVGGACTHFRPLIGPTSGAIPVGVEWFMVPSHGSLDETGDPFRAIVDGSPIKSLTQPLEQHAQWIVDHIRQSRADGFIYGYKWGCNFGSSAAHVICDVVKNQTGVPTLIMETDMIGRLGSESGGGLTRVEAFIEMLKQRRRSENRKAPSVARAIEEPAAQTV
jgi:benzoyl-CoA reductase/2-hydroxyglutaryl-CoA dehydratase subunit BcrC/BadD/HgdB